MSSIMRLRNGVIRASLGRIQLRPQQPSCTKGYSNHPPQPAALLGEAVSPTQFSSTGLKGAHLRGHPPSTPRRFGETNSCGVSNEINMSPPMTRAPVYYGDYLQVDRLLSLQAPESAKHGPQVHDEMLFIIVHQAYELWFKQALHGFDRIEQDFSTNPVGDEAMARIVHSLARVHEILKLLVAQLDVLETMTPADFLDFRDYLFPASGFQSLQFRLIETQLGLPEGTRVQFDGEAGGTRLSVAVPGQVKT